MVAAQVTHAAGESIREAVPSGTHAVVLEADSEQLVHLHGTLREFNVPHTLIVENDKPYTDQLLAIGVEPGRRSVLKPYFKHLKLLR